MIAPAAVGGGRTHVVRLAAGGVIGEHIAPVDQLLIVIDGDVRVDAGVVSAAVSAGCGVRWHEGEEHRTEALTDVLGLIIEGPGVVAPS